MIPKISSTSVVSQEHKEQLLVETHTIGKHIFLVHFPSFCGICLREFVQNASSVICWNTTNSLLFSIAVRICSDLYALLEAKKIFSERGQDPESMNGSFLLTYSGWYLGKERFKSVP